MNTIPDMIRVNENFSCGLDLRNPIEAQAYLIAAGHFLSKWPQDWSAERLCLAMVDDESPDKDLVEPWEAIIRDIHPMDEPLFFVEELISGLAEDLLTFRYAGKSREEISSETK